MLLNEEKELRNRVKLEYQTSALEQINTKIGKIRFNRRLLITCTSLTLVTCSFNFFHSPSLMTNVLLGTGCFTAGAAAALTMQLQDLSNLKQDMQSEMENNPENTKRISK